MSCAFAGNVWYDIPVQKSPGHGARQEFMALVYAELTGNGITWLAWETDFETD